MHLRCHDRLEIPPLLLVHVSRLQELGSPPLAVLPPGHLDRDLPRLEDRRLAVAGGEPRFAVVAVRLAPFRVAQLWLLAGAAHLRLPRLCCPRLLPLMLARG